MPMPKRQHGYDLLVFRGGVWARLLLLGACDTVIVPLASDPV